MFSNFTGFLFFCQVQNTQNTNTLTDWSCKITTFWIPCKQLQLRNEKCVCCCFQMMQVFTSILQILATLALGLIVVLRQQNSGLSVNLHSSWFYSKCRLPPYMHEQCIVSFHKQREENPTQYTKEGETILSNLGKTESFNNFWGVSEHLKSISTKTRVIWCAQKGNIMNSSK